MVLEFSKEWRPLGLRQWASILLILSNIAIISIIVALERASNAHNGFTSLSAKYISAPGKFSIRSFTWAYHLLWTSLPGWILTFYGLGWNSAVQGTAERQPYVELNDKGKQTASHTILLDYRAYILPKAIVRAFRTYRHWHVGVAMTLSLISQVTLVPLSASLFTAVLTSVSSSVPLSLPKIFISAEVPPLGDLYSVVALTEATMVYNASPPAWTNLKYAFQPFNSATNFSGNLTGTVSGYGSDLDCVILENGTSYAAVTDGTTITFDISDRGCTSNHLS